MKRLLLTAAGLFLSAGLASAAVTADQLIASYQAKGYTTIDVKSGVSQIKVEAVKDLTKIEVVYDMTSGAVLSQQESAAEPSEANKGVETATSDHDFLAGGTTVASDETNDTAEKSTIGGTSGGIDGSEGSGAGASGSGGEGSGGHDSGGHDAGGEGAGGHD